VIVQERTDGSLQQVVSLTTKENAFVVSKLEKEMSVDIIHSTVYGGKIIRAEELPKQVRKRSELSKGAHLSKKAENQDSKREDLPRTAETKAQSASQLGSKRRRRKTRRRMMQGLPRTGKQNEAQCSNKS